MRPDVTGAEAETWFGVICSLHGNQSACMLVRGRAMGKETTDRSECASVSVCVALFRMWTRTR